MRSINLKSIPRFWKYFSAFSIFVLLVSAHIASGATIYPAGSLLQTGDVTSTHIRDNTILNADVNASAAIDGTKIKLSNFDGVIAFASSTAVGTTTNLRYSTSTRDFYVMSGRINATSTNFNGFNQTWPSTAGLANQVLLTDGAGTLSWSTPASAKYSYASTSSATINANITYTSTGLAIPASTLTASSTIEIAGTYTCVSGGSSANFCEIRIVDDLGNIYGSYTAVNAVISQTLTFTYRIFIYSNSATNAQRSVMDGFEVSTQSGVIPRIWNTSSTNSVDWTGARTFSVRLITSTGASNTGTLNPYSIKVTP